MSAASLTSAVSEAVAPDGFAPCPTWCALPSDHLDENDREEGCRYHERTFGETLELVQFDGSGAEVLIHTAAWPVGPDTAEKLRTLAANALALARSVEACA